MMPTATQTQARRRPLWSTPTNLSPPNQTRVVDLLCALYGSKIGKSAWIMRLPGGGFNQIIGIAEDLILRIPRFDGTDVTAQVSLLRAPSSFQR